MNTGRRLLVLLVGALALALVSCGGADGSGEEQSSGESAEAGEAQTGEPSDGDTAASPWEGDGDEVSRDPIAVEAVEAEMVSAAEEIRVSGVIQGVQEARMISETQGTIEGVSFELGRTVEKGDVLVSLSDEIERLQMEQARRQLETAQLELQATEQLAERGSSSRAELSRVRANTVGAEAAYEQAKKRYEDRSIDAPISGQVAAKNRQVTSGDYLSPNVEIGRIVDLSTLEIEIAVGEREVGYLEEGATAWVDIPVCGEESPVEAEVTSIAAGSDPETGSYSAVVRWDNTCGEAVRSGMSANVTVEPQGVEEVLAVPSQAVGSGTDGAYVYLHDDGVARRVSVEVGRRLGAQTEILAGISESDVVITTATSRLRDGDPVDITMREEQEDAL